MLKPFPTKSKNSKHKRAQVCKYSPCTVAVLEPKQFPKTPVLTTTESFKKHHNTKRSGVFQQQQHLALPQVNIPRLTGAEK